jgi:hypothetical protein
VSVDGTLGRWKCTCANTAAQMDDLRAQVSQWESSLGTVEGESGCVHATTMRRYYRPLPLIGPFPLFTEFSTKLRTDATPCWSVEVSGVRAVVWKFNGRLRCNMCQSIGLCGHIVAILSTTEGDSIDSDVEQRFEDEASIRFSDDPIDVGSTTSTYWMELRAKVGLKKSLESAIFGSLPNICRCGSPICRIGFSEVQIFSHTSHEAIIAPAGRCGNDHDAHWSGHDLGVFRISMEMGTLSYMYVFMNADVLVAIVYESIMQVLDAVHFGGSTFIGSYRMMKSAFLRTSGFVKFLSSTQFQLGMWHFLRIMLKNYKESFTCPHCGTLESAPVLVFDGTSLGYKKKFIPNLSEPPRTPVIRRGVPHRLRVFISDAKTRIELRDCLKSNASIRPSLLSGECYWLHPIVTQYDGVVFPPSLRMFLLDLTTESSFPGGIVKKPRVVSNALRIIIEQESPVISAQFILEVASTCYVSLSTLILACGWRVIPDYMLSFVSRCIEILERIEPWNEYEVVESASEESEMRGYFGSGLPLWRSYNHYSIYTRTHAGCNKLWGSHPALTPGIMLVCCPHGICLAFETMNSSESPESVFRILYSRVMSWHHKTIIYDAGCRLVEYILHREPNMLNHLDIFIDRLHYKNHSSCSSSYNMDEYPRLADINSVINEQFNSTVSHCKRMISYMTHRHFVLFMKWLISRKNDERVLVFMANKARGRCQVKLKELSKTISALGSSALDICQCQLCVGAYLD